MHGLHVPVTGDELARQPVEQLRVAGGRRLRAQVVRVVDQAPAEMSLPNSIDDDPRDERIVRIGEPAGQRRPSTVHTGPRGNNLCRRFAVAVEHGKEAGLHFANRFLVAATRVEKGRRDRTGNFHGCHHVGHAWRFGSGGFEFGRLPSQLRKTRAVGGAHLGDDLRFADLNLPVGPKEELPLQRRPLFDRFIDRGQHLRRKSLATFGRRPRASRADNAKQVISDASRALLPGGQLPLVLDNRGRRSNGHFFDRNDAGKERLEPVKVVLLDRIELVIVALGTTDRQSEEDGADVAGQVVERVLPREGHDRGVAFVRPHPQIAGRDLGVDVVGKQFVSRQLFLHESVIGNVGVERPHDEVAIFPGEGPQRIGLIAGRFRKPNQIEPRPSPGFAVVRARQQPFNESRVGIGSRVGGEGLHLRRSRRQAGQVERDAANQLAAGSGGRKGEPAFGKPGE